MPGSNQEEAMANALRDFAIELEDSVARITF